MKRIQFKDKQDGETKRVRPECDEGEVGDWGLWGPYLSERQWGTVREDLSRDGDCWSYLSHDAAARTAYTSGEDGLLGICDRECVMCLSTAVWNYADPCLKERLFGLTGPQGNHGEDVKEVYHYLDNNPRHSYMHALYRYPHRPFPYEELVSENKDRGPDSPELELIDTDVFDGGRYWNVYMEYAKISPTDLIGCVTVMNQSELTKKCVVMPQAWYRNTWHSENSLDKSKPKFKLLSPTEVQCTSSLGKHILEFYTDTDSEDLEVVFTDNESRPLQLEGDNSETETFYKDAFHRYITTGEKTAVNPNHSGTKCGAICRLTLPPGGDRRVYWTLQRLAGKQVYHRTDLCGVFSKRRHETDLYYSKLYHPDWRIEEKNVARQAAACLLWSKQFYKYNMDDYLTKFRKHHEVEDATNEKVVDVPRNKKWTHLNNSDVISMPDKWEFPWYAPWDLAFHLIPLSRMDVEFCKHQTKLFLSDKYMKSNGQLPGCEFNLDDPNPPLHAWACLEVYNRDKRRDVSYLSHCYHRLLTNYDWWMSRLGESSLYTGGGFLGMDNISVIDRSQPPPTGYSLTQADGTAWVALASLNMLDMALQLISDPQTAHQSERFFDNFLRIAVQMNKDCSDGGLWHDGTKFYYDALSNDSDVTPIAVKSFVGLVPLCVTIEMNISNMAASKNLLKRLDSCTVDELKHVHKLGDGRYLLSLVPQSRVADIMSSVCDTSQFLSRYGLRSLSKSYESERYNLILNDQTYTLSYAPGESTSAMFGGNSNWRGPIWLCMNYLLLRSLERLDGAFSDTYKVEHPSGSGRNMTLGDVTTDIVARIVTIFLSDSDGRRPLHGPNDECYMKPDWRDKLLFHEFFDGNTGRGCGASHQTGWTALIIEFLHRKYDKTWQ